MILRYNFQLLGEMKISVISWVGWDNSNLWFLKPPRGSRLNLPRITAFGYQLGVGMCLWFFNLIICRIWLNQAQNEKCFFVFSFFYRKFEQSLSQIWYTRAPDHPLFSFFVFPGHIYGKFWTICSNLYKFCQIWRKRASDYPLFSFFHEILRGRICIFSK